MLSAAGGFPPSLGWHLDASTRRDFARPVRHNGMPPKYSISGTDSGSDSAATATSGDTTDGDTDSPGIEADTEADAGENGAEDDYSCRICPETFEREHDVEAHVVRRHSFRERIDNLYQSGASPANTGD